MQKMRGALRACAMVVLMGLCAMSCDEVSKLLTNVGLSEGEIVQGLRTALDSSANATTQLTSKVNGFLLNELIKIAAPPEVVDLKNSLDAVAGNKLAAAAFTLAARQSPDAFLKDKMGSLVESINHAAEEGAKQAYPIFKKAITDMTITDGLGILQGGKTAATDYLRSKTYDALVKAFSEPVKAVVDKGEVSRLWKPVAEKYNMVGPLVSGRSFAGYKFTGPERVNPDLSQYITERAMDGLFKMVAQEEASIRANPRKYASDIIRRVFGSFEAKAAWNK